MPTAPPPDPPIQLPNPDDIRAAIDVADERARLLRRLLRLALQLRLHLTTADHLSATPGERKGVARG
ncbi:MAG TPA: hypothetical protein VKE74_01150 [Gemmataceae bacterium]|nr:hypothetical protein [Gemmataceae bacterium]